MIIYEPIQAYIHSRKELIDELNKIVDREESDSPGTKKSPGLREQRSGSEEIPKNSDSSLVKKPEKVEEGKKALNLMETGTPDLKLTE